MSLNYSYGPSPLNIALGTTPSHNAIKSMLSLYLWSMGKYGIDSLPDFAALLNLGF
jgi:hypothetical protein